MLRAKLFGYPQLSVNERSLSLSLPGRGLALFTYLLTDHKPHSRTTLTDLLWADVSEQQARENLRSLLYTLRQSLGDYLLVTRQTVAFNSESPYWLDIEVFNQYFGASQSLTNPVLFTETINLSQRDFLDGFYVQNAPVFDVWLLAQRQHLRQQAVQGWQQLADYYLAQGQYEAGQTVIQRLLALAPWHEEAHRQQMRLLAQSGRRSAALIQYAVCCQALRDELDVPPSPATIALYEQIKAQEHASADPTLRGRHQRCPPPTPARRRSAHRRASAAYVGGTPAHRLGYHAHRSPVFWSSPRTGRFTPMGGGGTLSGCLYFGHGRSGQNSIGGSLRPNADDSDIPNCPTLRGYDLAFPAPCTAADRYFARSAVPIE